MPDPIKNAPRPLPTQSAEAPKTTTQPAAAPAPGSTPALPDLVIDTYSSFMLQPPMIRDGKLNYGFGIGNRGPGHLLVLGERASPTDPVFKTFQVAYQGQTPVVVNENAGELIFEPDNHMHFHYKDTARFSLEKSGVPGWKSEATKSHFLMMDISGLYAEGAVPVDPTIPPTIGRAKETVSSNGGDSPLTYRFNGKEYNVGGWDDEQLTYGQKVSAGKVDYYGMGLNAPLDLAPGDPTGEYTFTVTVDPNNRIVETNESNNTRRFKFNVVKTTVDGDEVLAITNFRSLDGVDGALIDNDDDEGEGEGEDGKSVPIEEPPASTSPSTVRQTFDRIDAVRNGSITPGELATAMIRATPDADLDHAYEKAVDLVDDLGNADGNVTPDEFAASMKKMVMGYFETINGTRPTDAELPAVADQWFTRMDSNGDGAMSSAELEPSMRSALARSQSTSEDTVKLYASQMAPVVTYLLDRDRNGAVSKEEVVALATHLVSPPPEPKPDHVHGEGEEHEHSHDHED